MKILFCENCRLSHLVGRASLNHNEAYKYVLNFIINRIFQLKTKLLPANP